jgi:hypothetical protein
MPVIAGAHKKKSKKKGSLAKVPPKLKPWIRFIRKYGGQGYTREELSKMYRKEMKSGKKTTRTGKKRTTKKTKTKKTTKRTTRTGKKRKGKVRGGAFRDYETDED